MVAGQLNLDAVLTAGVASSCALARRHETARDLNPGAARRQYGRFTSGGSANAAIAVSAIVALRCNFP